MPTTRITKAEVLTGDGRLAATIDLVEVGGGEQVVTVDGQPEVRVHPASVTYHVRLIAPDRMLSDRLVTVDDYDAAVEAGERYAAKLEAHAEQVADLASDLDL